MIPQGLFFTISSLYAVTDDFAIEVDICLGSCCNIFEFNGRHDV